MWICSLSWVWLVLQNQHRRSTVRCPVLRIRSRSSARFLYLRMIQKVGPALIGKAFQTDAPAAFLAVSSESSFKVFRGIQLAGVLRDIVGDKRVIALGDRAKPVPVEPFLRNVADVTEIARPQRGHGQQFRDERLIRIVRRHERVELDSFHLRHVAAARTAWPTSAARSTATARTTEAHGWPAEIRLWER